MRLRASPSAASSRITSTRLNPGEYSKRPKVGNFQLTMTRSPPRCKRSPVQTVELAYVDQGYTGPNAAEAAEEHGIRLEVVKHPMAKRGFVLLPRRWVVERKLRLGRTLPKTRTRLRTARNQSQRRPLHRIRHPHDKQTHQRRSYKFLTASRSSESRFVEVATFSR